MNQQLEKWICGPRKVKKLYPIQIEYNRKAILSSFPSCQFSKVLYNIVGCQNTLDLTKITES